jgi:peptidoglycan hydrolase-like amidase
MDEPNVSVAILSGDRIIFELDGEFKVEGRDEIFSGKFSSTLEEDEIVIRSKDAEYRFEHEVTFEPSDYKSESILIRDVIIGIDFHWQQRENQRFLGSISFIKENEKLCAVNIIPVEDYLTSVISSEMSANCPVEYLKAHAIISRSWLLAQIEKQNFIKSEKMLYESKKETEEERIKWYDREDHNLYDVCADDHCQRYQGITKLYAHNSQLAVAETRGLILEHDGKICDTRFSKSCGGITEAFENVWEPKEHSYLSKVIDYKFEPENFDLDLTHESAATKWIKGCPPSFCNTKDPRILALFLQEYDRKTADFYRWKIEYTQQELKELIEKKIGKDFGDILDLVPVSRGYSGRIIKLKIVGSKQTFIIGKELEIRRSLSESHLYSSAFIVEKSELESDIPQKFTIYGAGWGHGVGLCQIGAAVMSEMGYNFDEILLHYFRGARINKIYL